MITKKVMHQFIFSTVASCLCCSAIAAQASTNLLSQNCNLGDTCPIPGSDGGETHFAITPTSGVHYACELKSSGGSLKVLVTSGKNFKIIEGSGFYNANPENTLEIKGRFKKPEDPNNQGEIKFARVPFTAEGTVKCYAKQ